MKNENYDFAGFLQYDENNNFEDNLNFVNVIESDDENVNKSEDYFNFESSDSELDDTNNEKSEINETNEKFIKSKSEIIKVSDKFGEINLDDI